MWQQGYGYADIVQQLPVDATTTLFRIASVSKPVAATGLAHMVAEGIIDLDASLYTYVPYFPEKTHDITIRQLGSHLSGIRGYKGKEAANNTSLSIKEGIALFKDDPLLFTPGSQYLYSSYNWNLIALAMQEASGIPFEIYIKDNVLTPLQMSHTVPDTQDALAGKAVFYTTHKSGLRKAPPVNNDYKLPSGGYLATSADVARLGNAYLQGFIPESITAPFITSGKTGEKPTGYGIGWEVGLDAENRPFYGHVGDSIGAYALFYVYPSHNMVFSILLNVTRPGIDNELYTIVNTILESTVPGSVSR